MEKAGHEDTINEIKTALNRFNLTSDFENIYTIIEALENPIKGVKNSGPFTAYIANKCNDFVNMKSQPKFMEILEDFRRIIFEECSINPEKIENKLGVYNELFKIVDLARDTRRLSSTIGLHGTTTEISASRTIVTTNYDMSIELHHAFESKELADGFSVLGDQYIKRFDPRNFAALGEQSQWLIKLHGSIWQFHHKNQFCKSLFAPESLPHRKLKIKERMMIYPVGEKPILKEPYYTFYKIFKEQPWSKLVTIGHSFRDLPINIAILENLERIKISKLIIVDKEPEEAFKNLNIKNVKVGQRVIRVKGLFGEKETFEKIQLAMFSNTFDYYKKNLHKDE